MAFLLSTLTCIRNDYTANTEKYKTFFNVYIWEQKLTDLIRLRTWDWQRWKATPSACRSAYCCGDGKYDSENKVLETIMPHYQSPGDKTKPWCWKQCAIGPETGRHFGYHRRHGICNQHNCATLSACCSAYRNVETKNWADAADVMRTHRTLQHSCVVAPPVIACDCVLFWLFRRSRV